VGPKGDELFFVSRETGQLMSVPFHQVRSDTGSGKNRFERSLFWGPSPVQQQQRLIFRPTASAPDDSPDKESNASASPNLIVAQNWFEELKTLVP